MPPNARNAAAGPLPAAAFSVHGTDIGFPLPKSASNTLQHTNSSN